MPDPIQTMCSRLPGAVYNPNNSTCRYVSDQGTQVVINRNSEGAVVISAVGSAGPQDEAAPPTPWTGPFKMENIGISSSAASRLNEVQILLTNHPENLSPELAEQLKNELKYLVRAVHLGCDIRIALKLLDQEEIDLEALAETVGRINENLDAKSLSFLNPEAQAALCIIFNDPDVDLPSIPDNLWNSICD